ncbi:hypothetical protein MTBLM5_40134 [Magnetospirillum sp. LM-5]|nr:hypothetical protein MTBLM5_40134 [Magnetospirillum sp. LM-5]
MCCTCLPGLLPRLRMRWVTPLF